MYDAAMEYELELLFVGLLLFANITMLIAAESYKAVKKHLKK